MTPIMHARGKWELLDPFIQSIVADASYSCRAIRDFHDVLNEGIDIFKAYYEPKGIAQSKYDTDLVNATSLVTLHSDDYGEVIVPTTYIKVAPTTVSSGFNRMVLGVDIGVLPDTLDISYLAAEIKGLVSSLTGLDSVVTTYTAPITGTMTPEQAEMFEQNRKAAVANRTTFYAKVESLQNQLNAMTAIKERYEQIIIQAGLAGK